MDEHDRAQATLKAAIDAVRPVAKPGREITAKYWWPGENGRVMSMTAKEIA